MKIKPGSLFVVTLCLLLLGGSIACTRARSDADITTDVQSKIRADASLAPIPITVQSNNGVVVLSGNVPSEAHRSSAEMSAKIVPGVKGVINNLQVMTPAAAPPAQEPLPTAKAPMDQKVTITKPVAKASKPVKPAEPVTSATPSSQAVAAPSTPPAKPAPELVEQVIPKGTAVSIRLIDPVDTAKNKEGDTFRASLESPVVIENKTVIPKNADVEVRLVSAQSAGQFTGSSAVVLVVTKITVAGKAYDVESTELSRKGASRGKRSAAVIGGGAAAGALIGGIAAGGKGAAIGAAAGAGAGTGVQALTKAQQIQLPSETLLEFQLKAPLSVTPPTETVDREKVG